jgi:hypothetical protein
MTTEEQLLQNPWDDAAASMAAALLPLASDKKEGVLAKSSGGLPDKRSGDDGAEGGLTTTAGGSPMSESGVKKSGKTGTAITAEAGHEGPSGKTGTAVTSEPGEQVGGGAGDGGNLSQSGDASTRKRKSGKVGVSGAPNDPGGARLGEGGDASTRARKGGQVGISKGGTDEEETLQASESARDDEPDDDDDDDMGKSLGFDEDALIKSMDILDAIASGQDVSPEPDRRAVLAKGLGEGSLTPEEMMEFSSLMAEDVDEPLVKGEDVDDDFASDAFDEPDGDDPEEPFGKSLQAQMAADPQIQEGYNASAFLERMGNLITHTLDEQRTQLAKSYADREQRARQFNMQLAKSLRVMATQNLGLHRKLSAMQQRLETVESTPLPRVGAGGTVRALRKSFEGDAIEPEQLSRSQVLDTLETMAMHMDNAPCGEPLMRSVAAIERGEQPSRSLYNDVVRFRQEKMQGR